MADIKQAAKWMLEGKRVWRPRMDRSISIGFIEGDRTWAWIYVYEDGYRASDTRLAPFDPADLLADDWEITS